MNTFLLIYAIASIAVIASVFVLSLNEGKKPVVKTLLTIIYILAFIGVIFAMTTLEGKYQMSRLISSSIAAAVIGLMYLADKLGSEIRKKNEENK